MAGRTGSTRHGLGGTAPYGTTHVSLAATASRDPGIAAATPQSLIAHAQGKAVDWHEGADSGSRTHDIRLETSDDNHFTISAVWCADPATSPL